MAISEPYSGNATISATEISIVSGTSTLQVVTDDGLYQPFLDLNALADGDVFEFKIYEKVDSAATQRVVHYETLANAQGKALNYAAPSLLLIHGWDMTIKKLSGTDRIIRWSIRKVA